MHRLTQCQWYRLFAIAVTIVLASMIGAPVASADHNMETIVQDDAVLLDGSDAQVTAAMAQLVAMGVSRVRLTASWSAIAPDATSSSAPQFDATDPNAYPTHAWDRLDRAVHDAAADGLAIDIDIAFWAPLWATQDTTANHARRYINAQEYAQFAQAVARRYSGSFTPAVPPSPPSSASPLSPVLGSGPLAPAGGLLGPVTKQQPNQGQAQAPQQGPLPRVAMYTIWNEPNYGGFLEPQWVRGAGGDWQAATPAIYRQMVYAAYPAIKQAEPSATVLVGGTAPWGGAPGGDSVPPLAFIRTLACVDAQLRPLSTPDCQSFKQIPGDGWSHHAYAFGGTPGQMSRNPDDATIAELPRLTRLLSQLVAMGRLSPALANVWITEFGYPTDSSLTWTRLTQAQQARYNAWGEYLAWQTPHIRSFAQFLLHDVPGYPTGLYTQDGQPKLAAATFPAPLWAQYPVAPRGAQAARAKIITTTIWLHIRAAHGGTAVRLEQLSAHGTWQPLPATATWGTPSGAPAVQFTTDAHGYLLLQTHTQAGTTLRADIDTAAGWQAGAPTTAEAIALPAQPRHVKRHARRRRHIRRNHVQLRFHADARAHMASVAPGCCRYTARGRR